MNTKRYRRFYPIFAAVIVVLLICAGMVSRLKAAPSESDEAALRALLNKWAAALRDRDLDTLMSVYSPDVVAFDIVPPLEYKGREAYRNDFKQVMDLFEGPIQTETQELIISVGGNMAFGHYLQHLKATEKGGGKTDSWARVTDCFEKRDGKWLVVHEHVSVPTDLASGKSLLDLKP